MQMRVRFAAISDLSICCLQTSLDSWKNPCHMIAQQRILGVEAHQNLLEPRQADPQVLTQLLVRQVMCQRQQDRLTQGTARVGRCLLEDGAGRDLATDMEYRAGLVGRQSL